VVVVRSSQNSSSIKNTFNHSHCQSSRANGAHDCACAQLWMPTLASEPQTECPSPVKSVVCTFPALSINPLSNHLLSATTITTLTANTPWKPSTPQMTPPSASGPWAKTRPLYGLKRRAQRNPSLNSTGVWTTPSR
jgi:hypothetical protein